MAGGRAWWIAPSYPMSMVGWRLIKSLVRPVAGVTTRLTDKQVLFPNSGEIRVRSADNPDSLRGEGLDFVVLDECAFMKEAAWIESIRPALSDRQGRAMFISTPKGRNWFWRLFQRGLDEHDTEWAAWRFPTSDNPFITDEEIEAAKAGLPERIFRQEYNAEFIEDAGGIFRGVMDRAILSPLNSPIAGRQYAAGVDIASKVDYTVVCVMDVASREMVYMDRFNRVDYPMLEDRLAALYKRFNLESMTVEDNSIGQGVFDHLNQRGLNVIPFHTSNTSKHTIIQNLASAFEHKDIKILTDPVLVGELQAFEGSRTTGGAFKYGAPEGMHDDCVMALAIAWHSISAPPAAGVLITDIDKNVYKSRRRKSVWD